MPPVPNSLVMRRESIPERRAGHPARMIRPARQRVETAASLLLLLVQPVIFYWRVLIDPRRYIPFDIAGFHYPLIAFTARCLRDGIAPLWNPWQYCGVPVHADPQAQVFYPLTWIAILAGNASGGRKLFYWVEWQDPLHMMLAGLFAFLLLRRLGLRPPAALMGATVYQLGGFFASQAQHLGAISCGAWLPVAVLAVFELRERMRWPWIGVLAIALAMSFLAGFMATTLVVYGTAALTALAFLFFRCANWRVLASLLIGTLWSAAISGVTLIPALTLSRRSMASLRWGAPATGPGLPIQSLMSLIWPDYYHIFEPTTRQFTLHADFTFLYVYCGILTVILIALSPFARSRWLPISLAMTLAGMTWMMGSQTPVFRAVFALLPDIVRGSMYAAFALMAFCLFAGMTAAIVLDSLLRCAPAWILWAIARVSAADLVYAGGGRPMNSQTGSWKTISSEYDIAGYPGALSQLRALLDTTIPPQRIDYSDRFVFEGTQGPTISEMPTPDGDNPFALLRIIWLRRLYCYGNSWQRDISVRRLDSPLLDAMNVAFIGGRLPLASEAVRSAGLTSAGSIAGIRLYRNKRVLPRFFLVPRVIRSSGATESLHLLAAPDFNPASEAIVEDIPVSRTGLTGGTITVERYSANEVRLTVNVGGDAFLASSETMYPGWQATVDGRPRPLLMTNEAFRGLFLPAGVHCVQMSYHPLHLLSAAFLSLFSLLLAVLLPACGAVRTGYRHGRIRIPSKRMLLMD